MMLRRASLRTLVIALFAVVFAAAPMAAQAAAACASQTNAHHCCGCCPEERAPQTCRMNCASDYSGTARFESSPLRITTAPISRSLAELCSITVPGTSITARRPGLRCGDLYANPRFSKRYLLTRALRP